MQPNLGPGQIALCTALFALPRGFRLLETNGRAKLVLTRIHSTRPPKQREEIRRARILGNTRIKGADELEIQ